MYENLCKNILISRKKCGLDFLSKTVINCCFLIFERPSNFSMMDKYDTTCNKNGRFDQRMGKNGKMGPNQCQFSYFLMIV